MKRIAKYETNDGHLFDTREEAVKHIDASIGTLTIGSSTTSRHSKN